MARKNNAWIHTDYSFVQADVKAELRKDIRNPSIFMLFEKHKLIAISRSYRFCVYDLLDYGFLYWAVRFIQKVKR